MIDEFERSTTLWSLPSAQMPLHEWGTGRVKVVSRENAEQYRVSDGCRVSDGATP